MIDYLKHKSFKIWLITLLVQEHKNLTAEKSPQKNKFFTSNDFESWNKGPIREKLQSSKLSATRFAIYFHGDILYKFTSELPARE